MVEVEVFLDGPVAKLIEEYVPSVVVVDLVEDHLRVRYVHSEALEDGDCGLELLKCHSAVVACVDCLECLPVLVVLSEIKDQELELCLGNVVISMRICGLELVFGSVEGANDDGLECEQSWQFHNIPQSLIYFSQTQVAVVVDVDVGPVFESLLLIIRSVANWQLGLDLFPNLLRCHILTIYRLH